MTPSASELRDMATYLTLTGVATLGVGWLALRAADHTLGLTLRTKAFLSSTIAASVALLNVIIVAQFMFVSTSHDLKLLVALSAFSAVVTAFFSIWVATTISGRVSAIAAAVRSLAKGDLTMRVESIGADEVSRLARDVD